MKTEDQVRANVRDTYATWAAHPMQAYLMTGYQASLYADEHRRDLHDAVLDERQACDTKYGTHRRR